MAEDKKHKTKKKKKSKKSKRKVPKKDDHGGTVALTDTSRDDGKEKQDDIAKKMVVGHDHEALLSAGSSEKSQRLIDDENYLEDENDDDRLLVAAAETWIREQEDSEVLDTPNDLTTKESDKKTKAKQRQAASISTKPVANSEAAVASDDTPDGALSPKTNDYSLHVTQLSFDATEWDVRRHFVEQGGCLLTSVRLVYDRGLSGQKQFRGVAFIDCADEASYEAAKKLHHSKLLNRSINVRPTLSKTELAMVVQDTQEKVRQKIRTFLDRKEEKDKEQSEVTAPAHAKIAKDVKNRGQKPSQRQQKSPQKAKQQQQQQPAVPPKKKELKTKDKHQKAAKKSPEKNKELGRKASSLQQDSANGGPSKKKQRTERTKSPVADHPQERFSPDQQKKKPKNLTATRKVNEVKEASGSKPHKSPVHKKAIIGVKHKAPEKDAAKLTKKQRNRRAAIIMSKKGKN
ncbi:hypothetical protein ACA910_000901 [Epithemia clementina (nom. ined.)]